MTLREKQNAILKEKQELEMKLIEMVTVPGYNESLDTIFQNNVVAFNSVIRKQIDYLQAFSDGLGYAIMIGVQ